MTTTVQELIDKLKTFPPDLIVLTSNDDEGNGYRYAERDWINIEGYSDDGEIEVGIVQLTPELEKTGWTEDDLKPNPCVVIG